MSKPGLYELVGDIWHLIYPAKLRRLADGTQIRVHYHPNQHDTWFLRIRQARASGVSTFDVINGSRSAHFDGNAEIASLEGHAGGRSHIGFDQLIKLDTARSARGITGGKLNFRSKRKPVELPSYLKKDPVAHRKKNS